MFRRAYKPGDTVPHEGVFWVHHYQHRLAHPVRIVDGKFPNCGSCGERVRFEEAAVGSEATSILHDNDFKTVNDGTGLDD